MNKQEAKIRITKLKSEINHHRYLYHVLDKEEISEAALDSLKHELFELEQKFPELITADSPTQRIGGQPLGKFSKVRHSQPVLSLQDVFSLEEIEKWVERNKKIVPANYEYYCELKLDGLTVVLTYENGIFVQAATRGDGFIGEDVTQNLKTIESIPLSLIGNSLPEKLEVRGEVVMNKKFFEKLNKEQIKKGLSVFANPRNMAAGSIRQLDPAISASRRLEFYAFEIMTDLGQKTHQEVHHQLAEFGFKTNNKYNQLCQNVKEAGQYLQKWENKRQQLNYQTDGAVIVINNLETEKKLGHVGKAERWMVAYKFPAEQATTTVEDIKVQVGRTGTMTPIAVLKPVKVAGSTVSRATLHNQDEIDRLDVRIGDTVIIQKAGDVIPDIVNVLPNLRTGQEKKFIMPSVCPICNSKVIRPAGEVNYYCSNPKCFAVEKEKIIHFVSKKAFNIEGLGEKIIEQLINEGIIVSPADIFKLKEGDLEPLERFGEKSSANLIRAIDQAKEISLAKFIYALGIRHVGEQTAVELANKFGSLEKLQQATAEELKSLSDVGEVMAKSLYEYFHNQENLELLSQLKNVGVKIISSKSLENGKFSGQTFVLTGSLSSLSREQAGDKIRQNGGQVSSSVSSKTNYVVAGEKPGSKLGKAEELQVKILSEEEFLKMIE